MIKKYLKLGIPEDFSCRSWNDLQELNALLEDEEKIQYAEIISLIKKWLRAVLTKKTFLGLLLCGHNGSGKTTVGCLLLLSFVENNIPAYRVTMTKLQQAFFEHWKIPEVTLMKGVLFIDEVGKEYKTKAEHVDSVLEYILKYRSERKFITILVSNGDIEWLSIRYKETVESILRGKFFTLNFPDVDIRSKTVGNEINKILGGKENEE